MKALLKIFCFVLTVLYLPKYLLCKNNIEIEGRSNTSQIDDLASRFGSLVFSLSKKYFFSVDVIYMLLPKDTDNHNMMIVMEKTLQKMLSFWTVVTNDTYCCDSIRKIIMSYNKVIKTYRVPKIYIIPIHQSEKMGYLESQLMKFKEDDTFNPRATFVLVKLTEQCGKIDENSIQNANIFNVMWRSNLFATILFILSECDFYLSVITAQPFSTENTCRRVSEGGMKLSRLSPVDTFNVNTSLLYDEPKNLQGCVFWIGAIPIPPYVVGEQIKIKNETHYKYVGGIDIQLMQLLTDRINFTYKFAKTHSYGVDAWFARSPNGTVIGIVQDLIDHNIDIAFGGVMPSYVIYYRLDHSTTYKFSAISWYVTDPSFIPGWMIFFIAFPFEVWIFSVVIFIIVSILYYTMESYVYSKPLNRGFKEVYFSEFFSLNLGMSCTLNPYSISLRVLLCMWAVYSLHWASAYTSILFTLLTNPPLERKIVTIQDLKNSKLKVGLDVLYLEYFGHSEIDKTTKSVFDNHFVCPSLETCIQQFVKFRNFSVMDKDVSVEYLVNLQRSKIHKLSDQMMSYFVSIITNKGNTLSNELNKLLALSFQSGLLLKWENDVSLYYHNITSIEIPLEENKLPLTIRDLGGAFFILLTGLLISFLVYFGEIVVYQYKSKRPKTAIIHVKPKHG